jgi:predicted transcriptional regulator
MSNNFKTFATPTNTASYVSSPIDRDSVGNRTCVFQAKINTGDTVVLQARIDESMDFVDVLTATDTNVLQEVVTAAQFRVNVTNASGQAVICAMSI